VDILISCHYWSNFYSKQQRFHARSLTHPAAKHISHSGSRCSSRSSISTRTGGVMIARRQVTVALVVACLILSATRFAHANGFTLEQVLSSPFPSDLIASKSGDKVAWVFDREGKRNLWIAEAPAFAGRLLTRYSADDGQEIT